MGLGLKRYTVPMQAALGAIPVVNSRPARRRVVARIMVAIGFLVRA
jgi:hypothetical protein